MNNSYDEALADNYKVQSSRVALLAYAAAIVGAASLVVYDYYHQQWLMQTPVATVIVASVLIVVGCVLLYHAIFPPTFFQLGATGISAMHPPVTISWEEIQAIDLHHEGSAVAVDLVLNDLSKKLGDIPPDKLNGVTYDLHDNFLRIQVPTKSIDEVQLELDRYWHRGKSPIVPLTRGPSDDQPSDEFQFNARFLSALASDRLYRVYYRRGQFYMIWIAGQGNAEALGASLGLMGGILVWWLSRHNKTPEEIAAMDLEDPATLVGDHKHNFEFSATDVLESFLTPKSRMDSHGPHVGRWKVTLLSKKKMTFQLEEARDMRMAFVNLPHVLGPMLTVEVEWDEQKRTFVKR